jgi:hypothetical protein
MQNALDTIVFHERKIQLLISFIVSAYKIALNHIYYLKKKTKNSKKLSIRLYYELQFNN